MTKHTYRSLKSIFICFLMIAAITSFHMPCYASDLGIVGGASGLLALYFWRKEEKVPVSYIELKEALQSYYIMHIDEEDTRVNLWQVQHDVEYMIATLEPR